VFVCANLARSNVHRIRSVHVWAGGLNLWLDGLWVSGVCSDHYYHQSVVGEFLFSRFN
jgi:hypothetical protein